MPSIRNAGASLALFAVTSVANSQLTPSDFYTPEYYANSGLQYTNAADAYALGFTGLGIKLGIADDQAQLSHPEFAGRVYSPLRPAPFPNPEYPEFPEHGTHVMGVAAAARNNVGMMGVAYNASIANVVAVPDPGYPGAYNWAQQLVDAGVSVMNASFGPPEAPSPTIKHIIGTFKTDISKRFLAIASPCPRSSASSPGNAPGVSINVITGLLNFSASFISLSAFL